MSALIGSTVEPTPTSQALVRARQRAALIPDCLIEARRVANTVIAGWHGRRRRGIGENFWQFRPYVLGENLSRIDWRRSARDDHTYIRDQEWEAAHTIWLWADASASMMFKSSMATVSKESRALVILLALAEILARSGERIASPGVLNPTAGRNAAERLALALSLQPVTGDFPDLSTIHQRSEIVMVSDFLDPADIILSRLEPIAKRGFRGHLIEIADPAEENFPYTGRTRFRDPETGENLTAGRAEALQAAYRDEYFMRRERVSEALKKLGWTMITHHTDRLASEALVAIHMYLSGQPPEGKGKAS